MPPAPLRPHVWNGSSTRQSGRERLNCSQSGRVVVTSIRICSLPIFLQRRSRQRTPSNREETLPIRKMSIPCFGWGFNFFRELWRACCVPIIAPEISCHHHLQRMLFLYFKNSVLYGIRWLGLGQICRNEAPVSMGRSANRSVTPVLTDRAVTRRLDALRNRKRRKCGCRLTQHQELCCNCDVCLGAKYILSSQFPGWRSRSCLHITANLQRLELSSVFPSSVAYLEFSILAG
jgi:hypothetical protein